MVYSVSLCCMVYERIMYDAGLLYCLLLGGQITIWSSFSWLLTLSFAVSPPPPLPPLPQHTSCSDCAKNACRSSHRQQPPTFLLIQPPPATSNHLQPPLATSNHPRSTPNYHKPPTITNRLPTTSNTAPIIPNRRHRLQPLQTAVNPINNRQPLTTISN
jgi:hypothetical protein